MRKIPALLMSGIFPISLSLNILTPFNSLHAASPVLHWRAETPAVWQCPPGQACSGKPDYRAIYVNEGNRSIYLSFHGAAPFPSDAHDMNNVNILQDAFRFGDLYWLDAEGLITIHVRADGTGDGILRFLSSETGRIRAVIEAKQFRIRTERMERPDSKDEKCRLDDIAGICLEERYVHRPMRVELDIMLPNPF